MVLLRFVNNIFYKVETKNDNHIFKSPFCFSRVRGYAHHKHAPLKKSAKKIATEGENLTYFTVTDFSHAGGI